MADISLSRGQIAPEYLLHGVDVVAPVAPKKIYEKPSEQAKKGKLLGWVVPVGMPRGRLIEEMRVTVWAPVRPVIGEGDHVRFGGLIVGASPGGVYVQAMACEPIEGDAA